MRALLVLVGIAYALMPTINEVPDGFPAALLWQFRTVAFALQLILWTSLGLGFGWLTERALAASFAGNSRVMASARR